MRVGVKLLLVAVAVMAAGAVIGFYVSNLTTLAGSPAYSVPVQNVNGHPVVNLEIQTVAAIGPKLSQNPDWVSYLVKDASSGQWKRETVRSGRTRSLEECWPMDDLGLAKSPIKVSVMRPGA